MHERDVLMRNLISMMGFLAIVAQPLCAEQACQDMCTSTETSIRGGVTSGYILHIC